ncbi:MAG: ATP-binding protein [Acidobacteriota bacterium]
MKNSPSDAGGIRALSDQAAETVLKAGAQQSTGTLLERALQHTSCGITLSDALRPSRPLVWVNRPFQEVSGYSADEVIGINCRFLQGADRNQPARAVIRNALETGGHCRVVLRNYRKSGELFHNELIVSPIRSDSGAVTHFVGVQTDVTQREEALQQNQRLMEDLRRSNVQLADFARIVFDELRSPLRGIGKLSELLHEHHGEALDQKAEGLLTLLQERSHRLEDLLQGVLGYTEAATAAPKQELVPLAAVVSEVLDSIQPPSALEVVVPSDLPTILGDRYRLEQILHILVGNAVQHMSRPDGSEGGRIELGWLQDEGEFQLWVEDDGPGIPGEDQDRVFGMFHTVGDGREGEGAGVGLALLRGLVEQLGGEVLLQSRYPRGARFTISWPDPRAAGAALKARS